MSEKETSSMLYPTMTLAVAQIVAAHGAFVCPIATTPEMREAAIVKLTEGVTRAMVRGFRDELMENDFDLQGDGQAASDGGTRPPRSREEIERALSERYDLPATQVRELLELGALAERARADLLRS